MNQYFCKTLWLMMLHNHTRFGSKMFHGSEDLIRTNLHWHFEPFWHTDRTELQTDKVILIYPPPTHLYGEGGITRKALKSKVLTTNTESCINYMSWLSELISVESGIRQGCPFSPMAFILGLELLALKIRSTPTIQGIKLPAFSNLENTVNTILKFCFVYSFVCQWRYPVFTR